MQSLLGLRVHTVINNSSKYTPNIGKAILDIVDRCTKAQIRVEATNTSVPPKRYDETQITIKDQNTEIFKGSIADLIRKLNT